MGLFQLLVITVFTISKVHGVVKVSFELDHYENPSKWELDGGCCDEFLFSCGSNCDNRFNLCFDVYNGNDDIANCAYGNYATDRLYENNDDFDFPATLSSSVSNPIIFTVQSWSTGFRSKIEVWDYDPHNGDDKIDVYTTNHAFSIDRSAATSTQHTVTLDGPGTSTMIVNIRVYCDQHYYGTSSGCATYCLARDDSLGHYDCNDVTGAKICHAGYTGSNCNLNINECSPNPCQYGAPCDDLLADFRCTCPAGTTGKTCDNINECSSMPCEHGGTCNDLLNSYTCSCPNDYTGNHCEFEIDPCTSDPCENGGTCIGEDDNGVLQCSCVTGFDGVFCANNIDDCANTMCQNNGTCIDGVAGFTCNCTAGFSGELCENDIRDECESNPCQNNATCSDRINGYVCVCSPGFHKEHCEIDIDECQPDPCVYGNCTNLIDGYRCVCEAGYSGVNCTYDIDDCATHECQYGSTCIDEVNGYRCDCVPGYTGVYCQIDIAECDSNPCLNGGICDDSHMVNGYRCICNSTGYEGQRCEVDVDECTAEVGSAACPPNQICVNLNGSYDCQDSPDNNVSTPPPGLCRTSICYNNGTCLLQNNAYMCVCTKFYSGELCQTPVDPCSPNPCQNGGSCRNEPADNKTNLYQCSCQSGFTGVNCTIATGARTGGPESFAYWYIILIVLLVVVVIVLAGLYLGKIMKERRRKRAADAGGTVFANPNLNTVTLPPIGGATAGPLPGKDKLGEPDMSVGFANNLYTDIDSVVLQGACALPLPAPPPYSEKDAHTPESAYAESGYADAGYTDMNKGAAAEPPYENHYEGMKDNHYEGVKENDYVAVNHHYDKRLPSSNNRPTRSAIEVDGEYNIGSQSPTSPTSPTDINGAYATTITATQDEQSVA